MKSLHVEVLTQFCAHSLAFAKFGVPAVTEGMKVVYSSGTELDDNVFEDVARDPSTRVLVTKYDTG